MLPEQHPFQDELDDEADFLLPGEHLPSPEEIAAACERIQARWSDEMRAKRWVGPVYMPATMIPVQMKDLLPGFYALDE